MKVAQSVDLDRCNPNGTLSNGLLRERLSREANRQNRALVPRDGAVFSCQYHAPYTRLKWWHLLDFGMRDDELQDKDGGWGWKSEGLLLEEDDCRTGKKMGNTVVWWNYDGFVEVRT